MHPNMGFNARVRRPSFVSGLANVAVLPLRSSSHSAVILGRLGGISVTYSGSTTLGAMTVELRPMGLFGHSL